jgi:predicted nucleic acid-binding protein
VILVDTGPLVALFDSKDAEHPRCVNTLKGLREPLVTTIPVLTEAFHMLRPASRESDRLRDFIERRGLSLWFFDGASLNRAFELMATYADHPMDLADASIIASAELLGTRSVFTVDRRDFETYKIRRGHRHYPVDIVPVGARQR